jgi:hypothetical protein
MLSQGSGERRFEDLEHPQGLLQIGLFWGFDAMVGGDP